MAGSSATPCLHQPVRSISLPSRLHPNSQKIEEQLSKLKTWKLSSTSMGIPLARETIQLGLTGLAELYNSIKELFHSPLTQNALLQHECRKLVEETLDGSIGLLDACGTARDLLLNMKKHLQDLQSAFRRRSTTDSSIETNVQAYITFRKLAKKDIVKSIRALKSMHTNAVAFNYLLNVDHHILMVIKLLRELSTLTISIFWSLLMFLSVPVMKTKANGWSLISKLVPVTFAGSERAQKVFNEVSNVDIALCYLDGNFRKNGAKIDVQMVQRRLETLDGVVDGLEGGLDCLFSCLIQHRVSLLNLLTP